MFEGPAGGAGQLFSSLTKGYVELDPVKLIKDNGLSITQTAQLGDQLAARPTVASVTVALAEKASTVDLNSAIATRHPLIGLGGASRGPSGRVACEFGCES